MYLYVYTSREIKMKKKKTFWLMLKKKLQFFLQAKNIWFLLSWTFFSPHIGYIIYPHVSSIDYLNQLFNRKKEFSSKVFPHKKKRMCPSRAVLIMSIVCFTFNGSRIGIKFNVESQRENETITYDTIRYIAYSQT